MNHDDFTPVYTFFEQKTLKRNINFIPITKCIIKSIMGIGGRKGSAQLTNDRTQAINVKWKILLWTLNVGKHC